MERDVELLDLVCGPASPLPETHQRYRLVQHIATGGQAEVYRAVRLSGGISSAPVTVKVFRLNDSRPRADQLRSWDKGDAVLMDLNSRGVPGICRRADGFYGPAPHPPNRKPKGNPEPYQVLDYLPGTNLRDYVREQASGQASGDSRLDAVGTLDTLVRVLLALHHPAEPGASAVVHMDIKPSNVMVLPNGEVRLIDFTGARYYRRNHITTIAYTREAGGPEAFSGQVGTAYDVHGFGAVAYYMVTGAFPRTESPAQRQGPADQPLPPWAVLRRHPVLDAQPRLREHLLAPLADQPEDRPGTEELTAWTARLADLVERSETPDVGLFWGVARSARVVGRANVEPVTASGDGTWNRIERLEQEIVELRAALTDPAQPAQSTQRAEAGSPVGAGSASRPGAVGNAAASKVAGQAGRTGSNATAAAAMSAADGPLWPDRPDEQNPRTKRMDRDEPTVRNSRSGPAAGNGRPDRTVRAELAGADRTRVNGSVPGPGQQSGGSGTRVMPGPGQQNGPGQGGPGQSRPPQQQQPVPGMRGVAAVPSPATRRRDDDTGPAEPEQREPLRPLPGARLDTLRRGMGLSVTGALFSFVCWGIWAIDNRHASFAGNAMMFVVVLAIAVGLFALCRLVGRLVIEGMMRRSRASARLSHLAVAIFLVATGISFAGRVSWVEVAYHWIRVQLR